MKIYTCCFIFAVFMVSPHLTIAQECPPCYKNTVGPDLIKRARDDNGVVEPVVVVKIHRNWESSPNVTDPKIWNAVTGAIARWNAADPTGPRILIDQSAADNKVSVLVVKGTIKGGHLGVSELNLTGRVWNDSGTLKLTLDPANSGRDQEEVTGRVGHEFGHGIKGLAEPPPVLKDMPMPGVTCPTSIMNPSDPSGSRPPVTNNVQAIDVDSAKKWRNDRTNCRYIAGKTEFDGYAGSTGSVPVADTPYQEDRQIGVCNEIWEVTNWYIDNDGWRYIGTTYKRLSPPCL